MATLTFVGSVKTTAAGAKTTTTAAPAVGDLIVVWAFNTGRTVAQVPTITDSQGGAYTLIFSATKSASVDAAWLFVRNTFITSTTSTTYTTTPVATDTGGGLAVYRVAGMSRLRAAAVRQTGKQDNAATGTPSITLSQALLTTNATLGLVYTTQTGTTNTAPPTGWNESSDSGYSTPSTGVETIDRNSGSTLTTVPWTAATTSAFASMLVELDTSVPTPVTPDVAALVLATFAPTVTATSNQLVTPTTLALATATFAPTVRPVPISSSRRRRHR